MILFFEGNAKQIYAVKVSKPLTDIEIEKLEWLICKGKILQKNLVSGIFIGPRVEMITPWSTNAVEITQNMGINGIGRIEEFIRVESKNHYHDGMLKMVYENLTQEIFSVTRHPDPIQFIDDVELYNQKEGLALNINEIEYLKSLAENGTKTHRFGNFWLLQVNSEHCQA